MFVLDLLPPFLCLPCLVEAGVETARITVVGKGSDEPSDTSGTDVGMSKNRRVEVELVP